MVTRGTIFVRVLAALLLAGILLVAGSAVYRAGYSQGYAEAALDAQSSGEAVPQGRLGWRAMPFFPGFIRPYFGFFPVFPLFGIFLFGLLFLFALRVLFGARHWASPGHWHGHPHPWGDPSHAQDLPKHEPGAAKQAGDAEQGQG